MLSGNLDDCDLRYETVQIASGAWGRIRNFRRNFPMANSANMSFTSASYNIENNRLVVNFLGTTLAGLVSGDTLFDFTGISTFPQNIVHVGDYKIRAQASSGSIVAREVIPISTDVSCSLSVDLA